MTEENIKEAVNQEVLEAKAENTEGQILKSAKNVFQSKGGAGAPAQEIADKVKINKVILHYY